MSPSAKKVDAMRQELEKRNQGHLLRYWDQIQPQQQQMLFDDLQSINFEEVPYHPQQAPRALLKLELNTVLSQISALPLISAPLLFNNY